MKKFKINLILIIASCFIFYGVFSISYRCFKNIYLANAKQSQNDMNLNKDEYKKENQKENQKESLNRKEVFLTFDDGPSLNNTPKILNILSENDIKATFFIVGDKAKENPDIVLKMHKLGMCIEPHTYSHEYKIYNNVDTYFDDLNKCIETINEITGKSSNGFVRLPGGSDNLVSNPQVMSDIKKLLISKGIHYVDWNVSAADAVSPSVSKDKIIKTVLSQCKDKNTCVILMHDAPQKTTTVEALPDIINELKSQGFIFKTFDELNQHKKQQMINQGIINR